MRNPRGPEPVAIELTDRQQTILAEMVRSRRRPHDEVHRATIILQSAGGARNRQIAAMLGSRDMTVRLWRARWAKAVSPRAAAELEADEPTLRGLIPQVLHDAPRWGRPATFTAAQLCQLMAVACEAPERSGRPVTHWTPRELADEVIKRGLVSTMSPRTGGRFLKRSRLKTPSVTLRAQS
jgi:putative transposase